MSKEELIKILENSKDNCEIHIINGKTMEEVSLDEFKKVMENNNNNKSKESLLNPIDEDKMCQIVVGNMKSNKNDGVASFKEFIKAVNLAYGTTTMFNASKFDKDMLYIDSVMMNCVIFAAILMKHKDFKKEQSSEIINILTNIKDYINIEK